MTCRHCMNWTLKALPAMGSLGCGTCNLQVSKAVTYPPHHTCTAFKPVKTVDAAKRDVFLKGIGL